MEKKDMMWSVLLHLGMNMWDDFGPEGPDGRAKSPEELKTNPNPIEPSGRTSRYHSFVRTEDASWKKCVDEAGAKKLNMVFVDLGEAVEFPSHPELKVAGTWSVEKMRKELARMRAMGLEPIPKLNFSCCHDSWLKEYHRMLATPDYYKVVSDLIHDACEIFDHPRYVHIGMDEEYVHMTNGKFITICRIGELYWHDVDFMMDAAAKNGAGTIMFADKIWFERENFVKRASKEIVMQNWYYRDFDPVTAETIKPSEKYPSHAITSAKAMKWLDAGGFKQMPCVSNWNCDANAEVVMKYCRENLDQSKIVGYSTASWSPCTSLHEAKVMKGIDLFADARDRIY